MKPNTYIVVSNQGNHRTPTAAGWRALAQYWASDEPDVIKTLPHDLVDLAFDLAEVWGSKGLGGDVIASVCMHEADICPY